MRKLFTFVFLCFILVVFGYTVYGLFKPIPKGLSLEGNPYHVSHVDFLQDLTYEQKGEIKHDHQIFDRVLDMIDNAEDFILFDMFLFNDKHDNDKEYPEITDDITLALLDKKEKSPDIEIVFITDEINTTYKSHPNGHLEKLEENGIEVILTNLTPLRDSNPIYSGYWRSFLHVFGKKGEGWITNPFADSSPNVTLGSYLKMLNLKGNHRKIIATEKEVMVTSANAHDASGFHSNIAFVVKGDIIRDVLQSEQAVANFSGGTLLPRYPKSKEEDGNIEVQLLTEGAIRKNLIEEIDDTTIDDTIFIGMFNLSESDVINALVDASERGVHINIILDPNETVFGNENIGIPNRPVAYDLLKYGNEYINVRWYNTHDEQYHSKLMLIKRKDVSTIVGGSANFTRRNLDDFNLDTSLKIKAPTEQDIIQEVSDYFSKLWNNEDANYTVHHSHYLKDFNQYKTYLFRFQKKTKLTTF
ncbi:phospholipase D family protein [Bacillus alkalicellulosilyticus]|uniref:phospholipase D family protein n=1 Tax=Alkalihalobacterium alkalicellulosilyticum TaxID=1912214 RepID=UPI0009971777|nr:phospholipase D family protein [Bacillus alkalicellulosilyticus]